MKRTIYCIFSFLLFFNTILFAQEVVWQKKMLQSSWTTGYSVKQASDGNYIVCGIYDRFYGFIAKLNPQGDSIWVTICPENLYSIVEANDGNYVAVGWSSITKISQNGELLWYKPISENGGDLFFNQITKTSDGNFVIAGRYEQYNPRINFAYIVKFDNNGIKIWTKKHSQQNYYEDLNHIKEIDGGNFIAAGDLDLGGNTQVLLMKLNSTGDIIWQRNYGTGFTEYAMSVFQLPDKSFLTIGSIWYSVFNKLYFTKTDSSGNFIWTKMYGDTNISFTLLSSDCAAEDKINNSYIITGIKGDSSFLFSVNQNGEKNWERTFGLDSIYVRGFSVDVCSDSGFVVCGAGKDFTFNRSDPQYLYALKTTKPEVIGISNWGNHIPQFLKLYQNYPNPFNPTTTIKYEIPKDANIKLTIYDITGREIISINEYRQAGVFTCTFDGSNLSSGLYFYTFETGGYKVSKKMMLIK